MKPAVRTLLLGQIMLYGGLAVCIILKPSGLSSNDGISYFGIYRETVVPYTLGLLGSAYCCWRAALAVAEPGWRPVRWSLRLYPFLMIGIVLTPYAAGKWVDYLHTGFGSALFSLQLILSGWLLWKLRFGWWAASLTAIELAAGIFSAKYLSPAHGFLIQSQIIFQLAFGVLLMLFLQYRSEQRLSDLP